jgi:hypothetical protein
MPTAGLARRALAAGDTDDGRRMVHAMLGEGWHWPEGSRDELFDTTLVFERTRRALALAGVATRATRVDDTFIWRVVSEPLNPAVMVMWETWVVFDDLEDRIIDAGLTTDTEGRALVLLMSRELSLQRALERIVAVPQPISTEILATLPGLLSDGVPVEQVIAVASRILSLRD